MFMPMMMDPIHLVITLIGAGLMFLPQMWVKNTVARHHEFEASSGLTGAQVAQQILQTNNIYDVTVEMVGGVLSDHYDPGAKAVRLSPDTYQQRSISALAIAAHEVGHAIQHNKGYVPVVIRSQLAPIANLGSQFGPLMIMVSLMLGVASGQAPAFSWAIAWLGVFAFGAGTLFHLVTLPVELDASARALTILRGSSYLTDVEMGGAKKVLTAAAMTYVAGALYALMELAYWLFRLFGNTRREE